MAKVRVGIIHTMFQLLELTYFIREGVRATTVVLVKLDGTILFQPPFPTSSSNHIISRVASDLAPCMLFHPTPNTENYDDHGDDSDRFISQQSFPSDESRGQITSVSSTEVPKHVSGLQKTPKRGSSGMGMSYAIGNPISKPYIEAIFGSNNRGRVLGLTVWI